MFSSYQTQGPSSGNKTDSREAETYTDYYYYCTETKKQIGVNTFCFLFENCRTNEIDLVET